MGSELALRNSKGYPFWEKRDLKKQSQFSGGEIDLILVIIMVYGDFNG